MYILDSSTSPKISVCYNIILLLGIWAWGALYLETNFPGTTWFPVVTHTFVWSGTGVRGTAWCLLLKLSCCVFVKLWIFLLKFYFRYEHFGDYLLVAHYFVSVSPSGVLQGYDYKTEMVLLYSSIELGIGVFWFLE